MEILPPTEDSKKSRKRVRFVLPVNSDEASPTGPTRGKGPDVKNAKKCGIKNTILRKVHPYLRQRKIEPTDKNSTENKGDPLIKKSICKSVTEELGSDEQMLLDEKQPENPVLDKNENCKVRSERTRSAKGPGLPRKKCKYDPILSNRKRQSGGRRDKKRKGVVSKKSWVKRKEVTKYKPNRKRKHGEYINSTLKKAKKRKMSLLQFKMKGRRKNLVKKTTRCHTRKHKRIRSKYCGSKSKQVRSKSSSKVKQIKGKIKKAAEKVRKATASTQKMSRLKKHLKKTDKKKFRLKQSLAKKRKQKTKTKKKKLAKRCVDKQIRKRRRKIKIRPIERELEVVEPLRVSLLKFLTFQIAKKKKIDCCRKYCCDCWQKVKMDDIIDDHD